MKIFLWILFIPTLAFGQNLRSVQVKDGDCHTMAAGWECFDPESMKKIDSALKNGVNCEVNLKQCENHLVRISQSLPATNMPFYQKTWFKVVGGVVLGAAIGVGIGASF